MRAIRGGATDFSFLDQVERTALHWCAMKGDAEAAKIAIEGGADISAMNANGETPLDLAKDNGFTEIIGLLANAQLQTALMSKGKIQRRESFTSGSRRRHRFRTERSGGPHRFALGRHEK